MTCYRGEVVTPTWRDVDSRKSLISQQWNITYITDNIENYTMLCTLEVDISQLPMTYERKVSGGGMYYRAQYDIVLLFGLTELQAMGSLLHFTVSILFTEGCWQGVERRSPAKIIYDPVHDGEDN